MCYTTTYLPRMKFFKGIAYKYKAKKQSIMKNILHHKLWRTGALQIYVKPPPISLIKSKNDTLAETLAGSPVQVTRLLRRSTKTEAWMTVQTSIVHGM